MSYLEDSIDWQAIAFIDEWLDENVSDIYKQQPLAQDWARLCKTGEELGEAIAELILYTGQNPRKGEHPESYNKMLKEAAQMAFTGILGIQHFTKNISDTKDIIRIVLKELEWRIRDAGEK